MFFEDLNDHDVQRRDASLVTEVGKPDPSDETQPRAPDRGRALAGKSTLNRLKWAPQAGEADLPGLVLLAKILISLNPTVKIRSLPTVTDTDTDGQVEWMASQSHREDQVSSDADSRARVSTHRRRRSQSHREDQVSSDLFESNQDRRVLGVSIPP